MTAPEPRPYHYTGSDILALNLAIWRYWATLLAIVPIMFLLLDLISQRGNVGAALREYPWVIVGVILFVQLAWIVAAAAFAFWRRSRGGESGPIEVSIKDDGMRVHGPRMQALLYWQALKAVKSTKKHLFLLMSRRAAVIVPRRAFANDDDFASFVGAVRARWQAARTK